MSIESAHLAQARHNAELAKLLAVDMVYKDWVITATFYAAVHYVEAALGKRFGWHGENVSDISPHIARLKKLKEKYSLGCQNAYRSLYEASKDVRYLRVPPSYYTDDAAREFLNNDLATIRKELGY